MRLYRGLPACADQPVALTIGNFDGVHRGHQAMLARLCEAAEDLRLPSAVMTFDPHPREFFAPDAAPPRLSTTRTKLDLFVEGQVPVEIKSVAAIETVHTAQLLTYLRLSKCWVGLLINFNVKLLKHGVRRLVLGSQNVTL